MDKERFMRSNSNKKNNDNLVIKGNYLMYYNRRDDRIGLERFNFLQQTKEELFISNNASKDIQGIWEIDNNFSIMQLLIEKYEVDRK